MDLLSVVIGQKKRARGYLAAFESSRRKWSTNGPFAITTIQTEQKSRKLRRASDTRSGTQFYFFVWRPATAILDSKRIDPLSTVLSPIKKGQIYSLHNDQRLVPSEKEK